MIYSRILLTIALTCLIFVASPPVKAEQPSDETFLDSIGRGTVLLKDGQTPEDVFPILTLTKIQQTGKRRDDQNRFYRKEITDENGQLIFSLRNTEEMSFYEGDRSPTGLYWLVSHHRGYSLLDNKGHVLSAPPYIINEAYYVQFAITDVRSAQRDGREPSKIYSAGLPYSVLDENGKVIPYPPLEGDITIPPLWYWKTSDTLIGIGLKRSPESFLPEHQIPGQEIEPLGSYFYLYDITHQKTWLLDLPIKQGPGHIPVLRGVTADGALMVKLAGDYSNDVDWRETYGSEDIIGVYDLTPESRALLNGSGN